MILDNEQQRKALLQIINNASFQGATVEYICQLKRAIGQAEIAKEEREDG